MAASSLESPHLLHQTLSVLAQEQHLTLRVLACSPTHTKEVAVPSHNNSMHPTAYVRLMLSRVLR